MLDRIKYLFYYFFKTDWHKLNSFLNYVSVITNKSKLKLFVLSIIDSLKYNISLLEYFQYKFYQLDKTEKLKWVGTGFMYEYQLKMNPRNTRELLEDKIKFLNYYSKFIKRQFSVYSGFKNDVHKISTLLNSNTGKLVLKSSTGQVGAEVEIISTKDFSLNALLLYMKQKKYDLLEEYVVQHKLLSELSPSGLNTVRIFTQLINGKVDILGARLRISINSAVDNMAAGNIAAPIDIKSGIVTGPGVYSDITKSDEYFHPVTKKEIIGFTLPFWPETIAIVEKFANLMPQNKSVGWDIAITDFGPEVIEGNHNWCKLLWQLPVKQGLKHLLVN